MSYVYTENMLFLDSEENESEGWTTDCGNKKDYDPVIVRISSRAYRDGMWMLSVIVGGDNTVFDTGVQMAVSQIEARACIEREALRHAKLIVDAVQTAYSDPAALRPT